MRVQIEDSVRNHLFELIKSRVAIGTWKAFSRKLRTTNPTTFREIRKNGRTFPEKTFHELLGFLKEDERAYFLSKATILPEFWSMGKRWEERNSKLEQTVKEKNSPHYLELKARLCGYFAGDGMISSRMQKKQKTPRYEVGFAPDDLKMAETFQEAFQELYGRKINIRRNQNSANYILKTTHKVAFFDLSKIAPFRTQDWRVPFDFLVTERMKSEWLRAFFDSEAHMNEQGKIQVQSVNKAGLLDVKNALESLGIETSKLYEYHRKQPNWNTNYLLEIRKKASLARYLSVVGFNHSKKSAKLHALVAGMAQPGILRRSRARFYKKSRGEPVVARP